jgi:hypothetical protein
MGFMLDIAPVCNEARDFNGDEQDEQFLREMT